MKLHPICLILTAAIGLAACATEAPTDAPTSVLGATATPEQEAVYSVAMGRSGLTARVNSNGCTKRADFAVQVLDGYPAPTVILRRTRPDLCRAFVAGGVDIVFSYAQMGLAPTSSIVLANPLVSDPTPGR